MITNSDALLIASAINKLWQDRDSYLNSEPDEVPELILKDVIHIIGNTLLAQGERFDPFTYLYTATGAD